MLVLTRRIGEEIVIAGNIRVTITAVHGQQVRLGITAPVAVPVARRELLGGEVAPSPTVRRRRPIRRRRCAGAVNANGPNPDEPEA